MEVLSQKGSTYFALDCHTFEVCHVNPTNAYLMFVCWLSVSTSSEDLLCWLASNSLNSHVSVTQFQHHLCLAFCHTSVKLL